MVFTFHLVHIEIYKLVPSGSKESIFTLRDDKIMRQDSFPLIFHPILDSSLFYFILGLMTHLLFALELALTVSE